MVIICSRRLQPAPAQARRRCHLFTASRYERPSRSNGVRNTRTSGRAWPPTTPPRTSSGASSTSPVAPGVLQVDAVPEGCPGGGNLFHQEARVLSNGGAARWQSQSEVRGRCKKSTPWNLPKTARRPPGSGPRKFKNCSWSWDRPSWNWMI